MKYFFTGFIVAVSVGLVVNFASAAVTTFTSKQLAPSPSNGNCLTTDGTNNAWSASCGGGGGGGSSQVGTSTAETAGQMPYWTTTSGNVALLGSVATGTLTETVSGLQFDATRYLVGGSAVLSLTSGYEIPLTASTSQWQKAYASSTGLSATSPLSYAPTTGVFSIQAVSASQNGYLDNTNFLLFGNKLGTTSIDTSAELAAILGDETGTGLSVFNTAPNFLGSTTVSGDLAIGPGTGNNEVKITASTTYPASNSVGGMVNLTNTNNTGPALVVYTNNGNTSTGNLANFRCDNTAMAHDCVKIDHDGAGDGLAIAATAAASNALSLSNTGLDHTLTAAYTGSTANKGAGNFTSTNTTGSVLQVTGSPVGLGVVKASLTGGSNDSAVLSFDASGSQGQGLFGKCNAATTTACFNFLDGSSNSLFKLNGFGDIAVSGNGTSTNWFATVASSTSTYTTNLFASIIKGITELQLPVGTSPTTNTQGDIALRTSPAPALQIATTTNGSNIIPIALPLSFTFASTSWTATGTIGFPTLDYGQTIQSGICFTGGGTANLRIGNGSSWSNMVSLTSATSTVTFTSNNQFPAGGSKLLFEIGTPGSSATSTFCSFRRTFY